MISSNLIKSNDESVIEVGENGYLMIEDLKTNP